MINFVVVVLVLSWSSFMRSTLTPSIKTSMEIVVSSLRCRYGYESMCMALVVGVVSPPDPWPEQVTT